MIGLFRLMLFGFIGMTIMFFLLNLYSRSVQREELEKEWDATQSPGDRDEFIASGMAAYEKGLRKKLIWLVYVLPTLAVIAAIYLLNFS
jgi:ABC-type multidrug transport system permease subunit